MTAVNADDQALGHGQKQRIVALVKEYFTERDKGWLEPQASGLRRATLSAGVVGEQAMEHAAGHNRLTAEIGEERGLHAIDVVSAITDDPRIKIRGHSATLRVTAATLLKWNAEKLGDSSMADAYDVEVERVKQDWRIVKVEEVPIPPTRASGLDLLPNIPLLTGRAEGAAKAAEQASAGVGTKSTRVDYKRDQAAAYARHWSITEHSPGPTPRYNPDYDHVWADGVVDYANVNDCTNFASQALFEGGHWKMFGFWAGDMDNWCDDVHSPQRASETWTIAYKLWMWIVQSGRGERWAEGRPTETEAHWDLEPGDLLFMDWDPDHHYDGKIDHVMVISGTYEGFDGFVEPTYSQHSSHRYNLPLSVGLKMANAKGYVMKLYPVHVFDSYEVG